MEHWKNLEIFHIYNNSKKNKNCLQIIYEYKLPFNEDKSLNEEELHRIGIWNFCGGYIWENIFYLWRCINYKGINIIKYLKF